MAVVVISVPDTTSRHQLALAPTTNSNPIDLKNPYLPVVIRVTHPHKYKSNPIQSINGLPGVTEMMIMMIMEMTRVVCSSCCTLSFFPLSISQWVMVCPTYPINAT